MNPQDTVFIPVPVSEKPEKDGSYWVLKSDDHPLDQFRSTETFECGRWNFSGEKVVAWLKPVKLSEITTSQPVSEWQLCPKCKGDVCWQDTIVDGQNISLTACTMCKGEGKILPPAQPVKSNEDILVKALEEVQHHLDTWPDEPSRAIRLVGMCVANALSSYRTSLQGLSGKDIGHYEYDKENEDFKIVVKGEEQDLIYESLDFYWRHCVSQLEGNDVGDIERKNYEGLKNKLYSIINKSQS